MTTDQPAPTPTAPAGGETTEVETTSCLYHGTLHRADELCPICVAEEGDADA